MSTPPTSLRIEGNVARIQLDDGKANAVSFEMIEQLHAALDQAEKEAGAALIVGRPGRFSAGFDLKAMREGPETMQRLVSSGAELLARMAEAPIPIVAACTGHALAMGALLLLGADRRIGAAGDFKIGLNEVAIGMSLPHFGRELAAERLSPVHLQRVVVHAEPYTPEGAVDAGFLDRVVAAEALESEAMADASQVAELPRRAFSQTKRAMRGPVVERIRSRLAEDMASWTGAAGTKGTD